jgi:hypothetical protein
MEPPRADVPEILEPQWLPLYPGIEYFEGNVRTPRLELWALRVDLTEPSLRMVVSGWEPVHGLLREGIIPSTKITGFVRRHNCAAGINANPFSPVSGAEGEERTIAGITVSEGLVVSLPHPAYDALVFYTDGKAAIVNQAQLGDLKSIRNAVGGFFIVLLDGEIPEAVSRRGAARHPRSAAGVSADGGTLYLLVIDGRRPGSRGATETETGLILRRLGAADGINLDGGGSTALAIRYPGGKVRAVNTPIHGGIPRRERGVAVCLGIGLWTEKTP